MGKRRLIWAAWLLAAGTLWLFENNAATLAILLCSAAIPCLSIALARREAKRGKVALRASNSCPKNGEADVRVETNVRAVGELRCENRLTGETARFPLRGAQELRVKAAHCGTLRLRAEVYAEDAFGLWRSRALPCKEEFVTAEPELFLPRVTLSENTTVISEGERYSQTKPGSDPSETFGVREYLPGDPIRQIHWKLSQKTDATMLRELGLPVVNRTLLVLRNVRAERETVTPEASDAMAEVFLSVSHALVNDGLAHTAAFAEGGQYALAEVQNEADFRAMESRVLTLCWEADDGALSRLLAETPYAHVAIVSAAVPPDAEGYCRGNRVSVLTPEPTGGAPGVFVIPFSAAGYPEELQWIEL